MNGVLIRSRARWASQGEKTTKYYCNMEKRHFVSKQMFKLIDNDGNMIDDTEKMLEKTKLFYQKLYTDQEPLTYY